MARESEELGRRLRALLRRERLAESLWRLVCIPSPTTRERKVALAFAEMLREAGAVVEVDQTLPNSPSVVGRLLGDRPGKVLQLAGHLDHIDVEHPEPERTDELISGRGASDMKCGLAGMLEIVRALSEDGCGFPGELLVTAYGLHEAPLGDAKGLSNLIDRKVIGDAAIVFEGAHDQALVMGKGQSIWNIKITRRGEVCHEIGRKPESDNLLQTVLSIVQRLNARNQEFAGQKHDYPLLGPQSIFVGQIHYGDFYNRMPKEAFLQGTWRWHPDRSFQDVQGELRALLAEISRGNNVSVEDHWTFVGEAFSFDPETTIVHSLGDAYTEVMGKSMQLAGSSLILDVNRLVPFGQIPAVSISLDGESGHADYEYVRLDRMEQYCHVALQTVVNYLTAAR